MQTYLFYDLETTGLSKSFDQVLHFAAIRTDLNLKELQRYELKIKLNPDVIPSPYALITHKMGIKEIVQEGITEFAAITQIHQWLNEPGTISLGYNTLGFDDEFLRFSFYRNLLKPYTHQFANRCYRIDIYPMVLMFFLFKNNVLTWPTHDGHISLKLENLNRENQFISGRSHHAMVDVEITLELARRLRQENEMWEYLHGYFKKDIDRERTQALQSEIAILINGKLGSRLQYQCPVIFLGNHRHYTNQSVWLRLDIETLSQTTVETIKDTTWAIHKKLGETHFILPYKERFLQHMKPERLVLAQNNRQWLQENPVIFAQITDYYLDYKHPIYPNTDIDASLYLQGFWTPEEEFFCRRFHAADYHEKVGLVQQTTFPQLQQLGSRILQRNYPEYQNELAKNSLPLSAFDLRNIFTPVIDYQGKPKMTPADALEEINTLCTTSVLTESDRILLDDLAHYLVNSATHSAPFPHTQNDKNETAAHTS